MSASSRSFRDAFDFVRGYWSRRPFMLLAVIVGVAAAVFVEIQIPARASDVVGALRSGEDPAAVRTAALWLLGTFALVSLLQQAFIRVWLIFAARNMKDLVDDGFARVQRFATDWHTNNFAGATVRRITRGMWAYDEFSDLVVVDMGPALAILVGFAAAMFLRDPWLGAYFAAAVVVFVAVSVALSLGWVAPANRRSNAADTELGGALADAVTCNPTVKAFGAEAREDDRLGAVTDRWHLRSRIAWRRSLDTGAVQSLMVLALLGGLLAIVLWRAEQGAPLEDLVYVLTAYFVVNGYLRNIGRQVRDLQRAVNELEDLVEIADTPPQVADVPGAPPLDATEGAVRFEQVRFRYPRQRHAVFEDLSVDIAAGERVALVGPSGAGKTSFVKLIQRLHDLDGGRITIDGQDIARVAQASLRAQVALVPQEPILFHRTLAENIAYGSPDASPASIEAAARRAHAHEFVEELPEGYETLVGERGIRLSGGERQRIAIARAILADAPLLILDEATSSLDSVTEHLIQEAIEHMLAGRTAIMVAHRLSTIRRADRILVFEHGRIVESGPHRELMANAGGTYRRLFDMQALGLMPETDEEQAERAPAVTG